MSTGPGKQAQKQVHSRLTHQKEGSGHPIGLWAVMMTALLVTMLPRPAAAPDGNRVAFVVGIGTYDKLPSHQQLKNPLNDAEGVSKKLTGIGFQVVQVLELTDDGPSWPLHFGT